MVHISSIYPPPAAMSRTFPGCRGTACHTWSIPLHLSSLPVLLPERDAVRAEDAFCSIHVFFGCALFAAHLTDYVLLTRAICLVQRRRWLTLPWAPSLGVRGGGWSHGLYNQCAAGKYRGTTPITGAPR